VVLEQPHDGAARYADLRFGPARRGYNTAEASIR
jgi:hypothetical protein